MHSNSDRAPFSQVIFGIASYVLWLVTAALGIVGILIGRGLLMEIAYALGVNPWTRSAIDKFGVIILGVGWLILTYTAEAYYRKAAGVNIYELLRCFAAVTGSQIALGGLAFVTTLLLI